MSANDPKRTFQREAHGKGVVDKVRTERPQDYLKIVASVMPKRMEVEDVDPPRRAAD
jgi:hypothetical protein